MLRGLSQRSQRDAKGEALGGLLLFESFVVFVAEDMAGRYGRGQVAKENELLGPL